MIDPTALPIESSARMEIGRGEPLGAALQRVALEQIAIAREGFTLAFDDEVLDTKVHLARKATKRARAVIRLVRDAIGDQEYRRANSALRDQARRVSELRAARVLVDTLETLPTTKLKAVPSEVVTHSRAELLVRRATLVADLRSEVEVIAAAMDALDEVCAQIDAWELSDDFSDFLAGARRVYRKGRRALRVARKTRTVRAFHDWRKSVNYLRYQIEALSGRLPAVVGALEDDLNELAELLGQEHDLADFSGLIEGERSPIPPNESRVEVLAAVEANRRRVRNSALEAGKRLYASKPDEFVGRLVNLWDT